MSTVFIILYILAVIAALLAMAGVVMIVFGLVMKNKKTVTQGSIVTGIAMILIVTGLFFGARRCFNTCQKMCHKNELNCKGFGMDHCNMKCDSMMMMTDSSMSGDTCKMTIEKKCTMHGDKPCDPSKCEKKCPHEK
jgi:hypothetical protein